MAKALPGFAVGNDPRLAQRLVSDNRQLRQRVADLEAMVLHLQIENDELCAARVVDEVLSPV